MAGGTAAPLAKADFTGHYELADAKSDWSFSLDVTQAGTKADISFSAANNDGSGAAPDGDGKGDLDSTGILKFKFTDSFGNAGNATLSATKGGYRLKMNVTTAVEPRALRFYGDVMLKKTANKPSP
jgi:hypothetical protein